jgi:error-prone DNA polymerase
MNAAAYAYAELMATSNFSFLRSGSHPEELVSAAMALGLGGIGIADRNSFAGVVRGYVAHRDLREQHPGFRYVVGVRLAFADGAPDILAYPSDREAYGRICRLLSRANLRAESEKGNPVVLFDDLEEFAAGQLFVFHLDESRWQVSTDYLHQLVAMAPGNVWLAAAATFKGNDRARLNRLAHSAAEAGVPLLAVNDVLYHEPGRRIVQDVVTCIREHLTLETAGRRLEPNAERHLKPPHEMARLFADHPEAIAETRVLLERIGFSLDQLRYNYPTETIGNGETAQETLERLTWEGARWRYPGGIPEKLKLSLWKELCLIAYKGYASYFLTVQDVVRYARNTLKILCQGRGSAANSVICYCLGITAIDPVAMNLLFERFISAERGEPPDIDVDFEHERREEVIQHIYDKYGRDRAGMVAAVITYRSKSALRDVSKALDMTPEQAEASPYVRKLMDEILGFPRHLSIHSGGFTLSQDPIIETVPIEPARMEDRTIVQWDKEDLAAIGLLKVDVLALGMLSALRKTLDLVGMELYRIPAGDKPTYDMICEGDTVGVFQIESRAQMGMLKRLRPRNFYDLVIEVAIVRPGPIVGEMVHPFLRRRRGEEEVTYPHPKLEAILGKTKGVPIFQEQVMKMAIDLACFTPGEADELRRAIGAWRSSGSLDRMGKRLQKGLLESGLPAEFVDRVFKQVQGFSEYGFPESHAASFALLAYASSYLKRHYPAQFTCALINSQPLGFYANHTLVDDVKRHGVRVLPVDPEISQWNCVLEREPGSSAWAIRLGFKVVRGMGEAEAKALVLERERGGPFRGLGDFVRRARLKARALESLAMGEAFARYGLSQRQALWDLLVHRNMLAGEAERAERGEQFDFFGTAVACAEREGAVFRALSEGDAIRADYDSYGLSVRGHPMQALRREGRVRLPRHTSHDVRASRGGRSLRIAGLVIARQRPPTAKGTCFATLEDEHGFVDLVIHKHVDEKYGDVFREHAFLVVSGHVQTDGQAINLIVRNLAPLDGGLEVGSRDFH